MDLGSRPSAVGEMPLDARSRAMEASGATALEQGDQAALTSGRRVFQGLLIALRPRQWIKNGMVFVPITFTANFVDLLLLTQAIAAFVVFCALSSAGYLLNDTLDAEADRQHPTKRLRPIPSGVVPVPLAITVGIVLAILALAGSAAIRPELALVAGAYLLLTITYTLWLKHLVIVDVFCIAGGFVLRAVAGATAITVPISPWLYTTTMLGALVLALGKRRAELSVLGSRAHAHRQNLGEYTLPLVDQLLLIVSSAVVMNYALYTFVADHLPKDHTMMLTIPVVLYGLFRYLFLTRSAAAGGAPEELLLKDRPLLISVALWGILAAAIVYRGTTL